MKDLLICFGVLGSCVVVALFCFWLFTGAFGDWLAYGVGVMLVGAYVLGAALEFWK